MSLIKLKTSDHKLIMINAPLLVSGSKSADIVRAEFDASWDIPDAQKFIQFSTGTESVTYELLENCATVPQEVLSSPGRFTIAVFLKSGDRIIKTSSRCSAAVLPGPDTQSVVLTDWNMFFLRLISALNDKFELSFTELDSPETILQAVSELKNPAQIRSFFIALFNSVGFVLDESMSDDDIALNISAQYDQSISYAQYYPQLQAELLRIIKLYVDADASTDNGFTPPELLWLTELENYLESVPTPEEASELEADRQTMLAVESVYEIFYIGGEQNASNT